VIDRCLEKNPTARFQSASDLAFALESLSSSFPGSAVSMVGTAREAPAAATTTRWSALLWAIAAVAVLAALVSVPLAIAHLREAPPVRFMMPAPDDAVFVGGPGFAPDATVSPDGRLIVFMARRGSSTTSTLWVRSLDRLDARQLAGTDESQLRRLRGWPAISDADAADGVAARRESGDGRAELDRTAALAK
jgi:hypothetical protein